jgi:signal peptidase I
VIENRRVYVALGVALGLILLVVASIGYEFVTVQPSAIHVIGFSMAPALNNGDYAIVSRSSDRTLHPHRGDVALIHDPFDSSQHFLKRIVGLPGEDVRVSGGSLYINGRATSEPYLRLPWTVSTEWPGKGQSARMALNQVFVLGDNRDHSSDSRVFGPLNLDLLEGVVICCGSTTH